MSDVRAIILAAGKGTRMRPLTLQVPKPLVPVQGKPLIDWCMDWLRAAGVADVVVNTSYLAEKLEKYLQTQAPGVSISREGPEPLETGGGIAHALHALGDTPFLAMNSDAIFITPGTPHPVQTLCASWDDAQMDFLMLLVPTARAHGWEGKGDFVREPDGRVRRAKPGEEAPYVFTGVELMHPRVFDAAPQGAFSLSQLWNVSRDEDGCYQRVHSIVMEGEWLNVGDIAALEATEIWLNANAKA